MIQDNELLRRAVRWVSEQRTEYPEKKIGPILDEAGQRFNLSPLQMDTLLRTLKDEEGIKR